MMGLIDISLTRPVCGDSEAPWPINQGGIMTFIPFNCRALPQKLHRSNLAN